MGDKSVAERVFRKMPPRKKGPQKIAPQKITSPSPFHPEKLLSRKIAQPKNYFTSFSLLFTLSYSCLFLRFL